MLKDKKQIIPLIAWIAVVLWMALIFTLSAQPATQSSELSGRVTKIIIETIGKIVPLDIESSTTADFVSRFDHMVRKFSHGIAYFILGVLTMNAFTTSGVTGSRAVTFVLLFCVLYAVSDEVHQMFVPGRGPQARDVLIDSMGAIVGIGMYTVVVRLKKVMMK